MAIGAKGFFGLLSHARELVAVMDGVGDFMRDDEVVLRFHRALHIIANGSCCFARPLHGARIGISQRNLRIFRLLKLLPRSLSCARFPVSAWRSCRSVG